MTVDTRRVIGNGANVSKQYGESDARVDDLKSVDM